MTLTYFLLARIAEDEDLWRLAVDADLAFVAGPGRLKAVPPTDFARRMLAECAAKRAILEEAKHFDHEDAPGISGDYARAVKQAHRDTLRHLAAPYADHPDYCDEWKP